MRYASFCLEEYLYARYGPTVRPRAVWRVRCARGRGGAVRMSMCDQTSKFMHTSDECRVTTHTVPQIHPQIPHWCSHYIPRHTETHMQIVYEKLRRGLSSCPTHTHTKSKQEGLHPQGGSRLDARCGSAIPATPSSRFPFLGFMR